MIINKRVIQNLVFLVILAVIFFTPVGKKVKTFLHGLAISEPEITQNVGDLKVFSDEFYAVELKGINTKDTSLETKKGKVMLLNFWGSWCPPCRAEMPSLQALNNRYTGKVEMVFLSMQDKEDKLIKYLNENELTLPVYTAASLIPAKLKPREFPTTYIVGKNGNIALFKEGAAEWDTQNIHQMLDSLVAEK